MKKICFITTIHQSMGWFVADAARYFAQHDYEVHYICNMDEEFIKTHSSYAKCHHVDMKRGMAPANVLKSIWSIYKIFKKEKFDVVQYATPNASLYSSIAAKLAGYKYRVYGLWGLRYEGFEGKKRTIFRKLEQFTCSLSSHVRIVSPKNMEIAIKDGVCSREKIGVIGLGGTIGVNTAIFDVNKKENSNKEIREKLGLKCDDFVFGFVGRINKDKGLNELIEAFKPLSEQNDKLKLVLVGMMDDVNPIKPENLEYAKSNPNVILTGPVHQDLVYKYLASFDVLTHPTYREGFGKIIQEAMAMRVPVITTDVPGPSEVVEESISGVLVPKADSAKLKEAMLYIYENPERADEIAAAGRKRLEENFTMEKMVLNIYNEYQKILGNR